MTPQGSKRFNPGGVHLSLSGLQSLKYKPALIILFITVVAYLAVDIFYKCLSLSMMSIQTETVVAVPFKEKAPIAKEPFEDYKAIVERNLFDSADRAVTDKQPDNTIQPASDIATLYDLRGTVAGDEKFGFAILEEKSKRKQDLYRVGDSLGGGKITKILRNSIIVNIRGEEKILKIAETKEGPILSPSPAVARSAAPSAGETSGTIVVNRSEINSWMKDIGTLLSQAKVRPYFYQGAPAGFLVTNIRPGSVYQRLGINNGDIIEGVNDKDIKTADDMMSFYNTMKGASSMSLNIKRQGRQETLNYVFR
ncbi:MAG: PDZ domain-containing protein [Deltaproteobacteria bacterium]|nr:PDZ domain-containing protein [Deltaproteobacteria bacterium]